MIRVLKVTIVLMLFVFIFAAIPVTNTITDFVTRLSPLFVSLYTSQEDDPQVFRIVKFGFNLDVDSGANEDIRSIGGLQVYATGAETLSIVSSSTADDDGSTGAEEILIRGIDGNGDELLETITLDGTTPVVTTNAFLFINRVAVLSSGSGDRNAGDITLTQTSSAIVLNSIPATYSVSQQVSYMVPIGCVCYINNLYVSADKLSGGNSPRVVFFINVLNTITTETEYIVRRELLDTSVETYRPFPHFKAQPVLAGEIINIEANSNSNDTEVSATIDLSCVEGTSSAAAEAVLNF